MHVGREFRKFSDGTSQTIVVSEQVAGLDDEGADGGADNRGSWSFPFIGSTYLHLNTPNSSVSDCSPACDFASQYPRGNECVSGCSECTLHLAARSKHVGGVNALFGDGHIKFEVDEIDLFIWQALSTIANGEVTSD
jgi:prepilin-type processing-associated H-X9-DG protein